MDLGLSGRCYIVTGGSRGLGYATAEAIVSDGGRIVLSARNPQTLDEAVARLGRDHVVAVAGDLADAATPAALCAAARDRFGRLDGALVSVGGPPYGTVLEISDDDWRAAFESIFLGGLRMARTVAQSVGAGGSIAMVLSSSARSPIPSLAVSNGLRPGLAMAAKTLADELGPAGVRVNALMPGRIATDRTLSLDALSGDAAASRRAHEAGIPLRRYGDPAEFGRVAAFVLSPAASYITGTAIAVDGGALRTL